MSLCFLLAAGEGRRLRPYTQKIIKPAMHFLNLPLSYYGTFLALKAGFENFIVNKHHLPDQVDLLAHDLGQFTKSFKTVDETKELLGSGGALWNARNILKEHDYFLIANSDEVLLHQDENLLKSLKDKHINKKPLATLLTCDHPELLKTLKAVWVNEKGDVRGFGMEAPEPNLKPVHYTGYKIFSKEVLDWLPEGESNIFYDVLKEAINKGETIQTQHIDNAIWHETGNFNSFLSASIDITQCGWSYVQDRLKFFKKQENEIFESEGKTLIYPKNNKNWEPKNINGSVVMGHQTLPSESVFENCILQPSAHLEPKNYSNEMLV